MSHVTITAEFLRNLLDYDAATGIFTWRSDRICGRGRVQSKAGSEAGTQRPTGYRLINLFGTPRLAHRLAWLHVHGVWPSNHIDHKNGDPSDNRIDNLRDVTHAVNLQNMRHAMCDKKHGALLGSAWHRQTGKWRALIRVDGRQRSLGYFETEAEAHAAYISAKRSLHEGCTI